LFFGLGSQPDRTSHLGSAAGKTENAVPGTGPAVQDLPQDPPEILAANPKADAPALPPTAAHHPGFSRWVAASLVLILALFVVFLILRHPYRSQASPAEMSGIRTLAVLPFQSLDKGAEDQYLGLGMTDALITRLSHLSQLVVRPIGAVRGVSASQDPSEVGRKLDVQAVSSLGRPRFRHPLDEQSFRRTRRLSHLSKR
jgi:hypothetical protein